MLGVETMCRKMEEIYNDFQYVNPYEKPQPITFDLRGYSDYVSKNNLKANQITSEMMAQFDKRIRSEQYIIPRRISDTSIGLPPFYVSKNERLKITKFYIKPLENTGKYV